MNLPNKLTISRIVLTVAFIYFLFRTGVGSKAVALAIFSLASLTDLLDGFLAKRNNQITDFGKLMDPIADKILILSAFLAFVLFGVIPPWMFIIIILREVAITAFRAMALTKGIVIPANKGGKQKTVSQLIAVFVIMIFLILREGGSAVFGFWNEAAQKFYSEAIFIWMLLTIAVTLISGTVYMLKNRRVYFDEKKS